MVWDYSGDPADSTKDAVRFLIGDTNHDAQLLSDEEIAWLLSQNADDVYVAAQRALTQLATRYSGKADKAVGDLKISYSQLSKQFAERASDVLAQAEQGGGLVATPYAGGISRSDKQLDETNSDRVDPAFKRDLHDDKGSSAVPWLP